MLHLAGRRRGYMGYIGWIGAEAEAIPVTFVDQTGAKRLQARVSPDMSVKKLLPTVISAMRLPAIAPDGTPMSYALDHKEGGIRLIETDTLADSGVRPGDHLIVYPEIVAGMLGDLGVETREDVTHLLACARNAYDAGDKERAVRLAEEAHAMASDLHLHSLARRAQNFLLAVEQRIQRLRPGPQEQWYFMGLGYEDGIGDVGLHTEAEQDHAERLAEEHYASAWDSMNGKRINDLEYNIGYLQAIKDLALHEGAEVLVAGVSGMIRELQRARKTQTRWYH